MFCEHFNLFSPRYITSDIISLDLHLIVALYCSPISSIVCDNNSSPSFGKFSVKNDNLKYSFSCTLIVEWKMPLWVSLHHEKNLIHWSVIVCFWMLTAYVVCSVVIRFFIDSDIPPSSISHLIIIRRYTFPYTTTVDIDIIITTESSQHQISLQ